MRKNLSAFFDLRQKIHEKYDLAAEEMEIGEISSICRVRMGVMISPSR